MSRPVRARLAVLGSGGWRAATETVVALIVLAVVGAVTGPQWDPVPMDSDLSVASRSTAIDGAPVPGVYPVRTTIVTVQLDGVAVEAQLSEPVGAPDNRPGVVFVHGAGTGRYTIAFVDQARALASAGVDTLVPNKRLDTYSVQHRDYVAMAGDYERSVALLRAWPGVDPDRVGVYAESEGAWIAPVMAVQDPRIAFVVLVSAPVLPPRQQAAFAVDNYLRRTHVPSEVFRAIPRAVGLSIPGAFEYADFDVSGWQRQMHQPVLVAYGTADASMPMVQGTEQILADTAAAGNDQVKVRFYGGANHGLRVGADVVPAFLTDMTGWVLGLPGTATSGARIAGSEPVQEFRAVPVPTPRWLRDGTALLRIVIVSAAALALALLLVLLQRLVRATVRRRDTQARAGFAPGVGARVLWSGVGALSTVASLVWYVLSVARLALDYQRDTLVVTGGWVGVRLVGVATVAVWVLLLRRVGQVRRSGAAVATGVLSRAALFLAAAGGLTLLLVVAYWGAFQLGI